MKEPSAAAFVVNVCSLQLDKVAGFVSPTNSSIDHLDAFSPVSLYLIHGQCILGI